MNVNISDKNLTKIPEKYKDKIIDGDFSCSWNKLTSLEGVPKEVSGSFYCLYNKLTSLEGAPKKVGGDFSCSWNKLTSLESAPKEVGGTFYCSYNKLTLYELLKGIIKMKIGGGIFSADFDNKFVNKFYKATNNHKKIKMIFERIKYGS